VLGSYHEIRSKTMVRYRQAEANLRPKLEAPSTELTEDQWMAMIERDKQNIARPVFWLTTAPMFVDWLFNTGRLTDDFLTDREWREYTKRARANVMNDKNLNARRIEAMSPFEKGQYDIACVQERKRLIYSKYLSEL